MGTGPGLLVVLRELRGRSLRVQPNRRDRLSRGGRRNKEGRKEGLLSRTGIRRRNRVREAQS